MARRWWWPWGKTEQLAAPAAAAPGAIAPPAGASDESAEASVPDVAAAAPPEVTLKISGGRKIARVYPSDNLDPDRVRFITRLADTGSTWMLMELFDDVAMDAHVRSQITKAKLAVAGRPVCLEPGDDSELGQKICDDAKIFISRIPDFCGLTSCLLDAEYRGFACVLPKWYGQDGAWWVKSWEAIESRFFRFVDGNVPLVETMQNPAGEPLPDGVLFHAVRDEAGLIARGGFGRSILKPWLYKGYCLIDGMSFIERFGHPHVQVELPPTVKEGSPELQRAKTAALGIMTDQVGLVPPGVAIKLLDAASKAGTVRDVFLAFAEFCDAAISKAVNGQTLTTEIGGKGSFAAAQVHQSEEQMLIELRASRVDQMLTTQLLGPWTVYHYGPSAPKPRLYHDVALPEDEKAKAETQKVRAETLGVVARTLRMKIAERQVREELELVTPESDEPTIGGEAPPVEPPLMGSGICPNCSSAISLADAQKKKRAMGWAT